MYIDIHAGFWLCIKFEMKTQNSHLEFGAKLGFRKWNRIKKKRKNTRGPISPILAQLPITLAISAAQLLPCECTWSLLGWARKSANSRTRAVFRSLLRVGPIGRAYWKSPRGGVNRRNLKFTTLNTHYKPVLALELKSSPEERGKQIKWKSSEWTWWFVLPRFGSKEHNTCWVVTKTGPLSTLSLSQTDT
jgi:hypothetical protein